MKKPESRKQLAFCIACAWRQYVDDAAKALRDHQRDDCPFRFSQPERK